MALTNKHREILLGWTRARTWAPARRICLQVMDRKRGSHPGERRPAAMVSCTNLRGGKAHFVGFQIDENVVVVVDGMGICVRITTSALEVLSTYEAAIDVDVR